MIAHVAGIPVEEALLPLATWAGAGLLVTRHWIAARVRSLRGGAPREPHGRRP